MLLQHHFQGQGSLKDFEPIADRKRNETQNEKEFCQAAEISKMEVLICQASYGWSELMMSRRVEPKCFLTNL